MPSAAGSYWSWPVWLSNGAAKSTFPAGCVVGEEGLSPAAEGDELDAGWARAAAAMMTAADTASVRMADDFMMRSCCRELRTLQSFPLYCSHR